MFRKLTVRRYLLNGYLFGIIKPKRTRRCVFTGYIIGCTTTQLFFLWHQYNTLARKEVKK